MLKYPYTLKGGNYGHRFANPRLRRPNQPRGT